MLLILVLAFLCVGSIQQTCLTQHGSCWPPPAGKCPDPYCCITNDQPSAGNRLTCVNLPGQNDGVPVCCEVPITGPPSTSSLPSPPPPSSCSDLASNCAQNANLCNNEAYYTLMTEQCAYTCNRCGCVDLASNCAQNSYLCNNSEYYTLMTKNCPVTCKRCP